ncbi:MAG: hypothetical protein IJ784_00245 [Ruminiclostridium sp.]|nr:hypothetical protein [Ruminiclostridium sp.]
MITASDATEFSLDDSEPYTVEGLYFTLDDQTSIYIDDSENQEYDEDNTKIVRCYNPLATIEIANYAWSQIGGLEYYGGSVTMRGSGEIGCGDVITVGNLKYPSDKDEYQICITDISYSISAGSGFMETLSSRIAKESGVGNESNSSGGTSPVSTNQCNIYFSADEPGANAVSGDFWAVQPTTATVSALFKYNGSAWSVASPFICSGQPPEDPKKDQYWCYISNNELTAIYQYADEEWVNVSSGKSIYKSDKSPPGDNDVWIEIDNDTDFNIKAVYEYDADEWEKRGNIGSGGVGEELDVGVHNERFNDYENNTATAGKGYNMPFYSHWEGRKNKIDCTNTTPFPYRPNAIHLEGKNNRFTGNGDSVHVEGSGNTLDGTTGNIWSTHVEGDGNTLSGGVGASFIGGYHNIARQISYTFIHGNGNAVTNSSYSFIAGDSNTATGAGESLCVGAHNTITVSYSEVFGYGNTCAAGHSIVGGQNNNVTGGFSAVFGRDNDLSNFYQSLAVGYGHTGSGDSTIVSGWYADCSGSYAFVAGNGSDTSPANSFTVTHNGYVTATAYNTNGADYAEYFEWADGNPENEDRRGMLVSLAGDKIQLAHGDDIDGVISANPSVCGNEYGLHWQGKYEKDIFGAVRYGEDGRPVTAGGYDKDREYIPRSKRPEWSPVGLVGRLIVTDDGSCTVGGYVSARNGVGHVTFAKTGVKVLKRLDKNHVEVLIK